MKGAYIISPKFLPRSRLPQREEIKFGLENGWNLGFQVEDQAGEKGLTRR